MKRHYIVSLGLIATAMCCGIFCNKIVNTLKKTVDSTDVAKVSRTLKPLVSGSSNTVSYVLISYNQNVDNGVDSTVQVGVNAIIVDSATGQRIKMTSLAINSQSMSPSNDSIIRFSYTDSSGTIPATGKALAGTNMRVKITGSTSADTLTQVLYLPKNPLRLTSDWPPTGGISNSSNLTLNWVPDSSTATKEIQIQIYYYGPTSQQFNSSLPATDTTLTFFVTDNGSYTIPSTDLSHYPTGCYVGIVMGRGSVSQARLPVSGRSINFWAASSIVTVPLQVN
jgi:hypothetical protein